MKYLFLINVLLPLVRKIMIIKAFKRHEGKPPYLLYFGTGN